MTADDYLRRVESELGDLPWGQRRELVSELRDHLAEVPQDMDLVARLGEPAAYAADLRAAAGLEHRRGAVARVRASRPRNVILLSVALVLIGLAIGSATWIQIYQPLALRGKVLGAPRSVSVAFHPGFRFSLGVDVQNNGRFTVRVLGVPHSAEPFSGHPVSTRMLMSRTTGGIVQRPTRPGCIRGFTCGGVMVWPDNHYEPFHAFDLKPGQVRSLLLVGVYGNCVDARNLVPISVPDFPVRFGFLWRTATARIPLPKEREIIPPSGGCPSAIGLSHHLNASRPAGRTRVFAAGAITPGVRIFCAGDGVRASALVPPRGQSVLGSADGSGSGGHATIRLTTQADGSVVARCTSGDLPVP